ncbi:abortive infection family protein [Listeria monocytogenes]|uniref:abortive infection family protein n=1 Tax=Listeria monocytogenes TaxID=1639 RepID=UPI00074D5C37|nr:abortive infection family protein [Listeria monocytogenes]EAG8540587.1 hypothetical protein [Listeria innocua]EAG7018575.1 hypothetical protein [Listeria monocytogenes]EAH3990635.1 hypothetical protein [Listeria monocytogenes]EDN9341375.1 abortive infection family protein [Listeria monocytogenes]EDN9470225.1 abortive infection family protein [Listeria monocytogenes]
MISTISKRDIFDILMEGFTLREFYYFGKLETINFFKRIFDLNELPSLDPRLENMELDIMQHTVWNYDWNDEWFIYDKRFSLMEKDDKFIDFLNQVFHPMVRNESSPWRDYLNKVNDILEIDGYKLSESRKIANRPCFEVKKIKNEKFFSIFSEELKDKFSSEYIDDQIDIMLSMVDSNPNIAIGKAKELIESCAKSILEDLKIEHKNLNYIQLVKLVLKELNLNADSQDKDSKIGNVAAKILGNLSSINQSMAELRNLFGDGHGRAKSFKSLPPRYARLSVGVAITTTYFMWETYQERNNIF